MRKSMPSSWWNGFYSRHRTMLWVAQAVVLLVLGIVIASLFRSGPSRAPATSTTQMTEATAGPSMWTCSMHPQIRSASPGKCPICGMDLIPVANKSGGMRTLTVSPETRGLMNIATAPVVRKYVSHEIPMVGKVDYDETKFGYITAWVPGRLDRLYVDYTGVQVNKGDHMVYIYSPELYSAQEELIQALKYQASRQDPNRFTPSINLVESAREKLRLLGLTEEQIRGIERQDRPSDHLTIYSPVSGVVIEKLKQEGEYVKTGERVYTVADLNQVWVHLDAYEADLPWVRYGQNVTITTEAYPGEEFHGRIAFIQPVLNDKTRTVKVRVNVPNPNGKLKPEMFVHAVVRPQVAAAGRVMDPSLAGKWISPMHPEIVKDEPGTCDICGMPLVRAESLGFVTPDTDENRAPLVIPYSAALVTGRRAIVYVELPETPRGIGTAFEGIRAALSAEDIQAIRNAFAVLSDVLDRPYGEAGTGYAQQLWNRYANQLATHVLAGQRVRTKEEAQDVFALLEPIMSELQQDFAPLGQPTFEGREIVLGPRAGNYYLVRNGLKEGELVVTQGNFKIDAEIQIQAKPSMMTPEGGGGGGHDHGGAGTTQSSADEHAGHKIALPAAFNDQLRALQGAYEQVAKATEQQDAGKATAAFAEFGRTLEAVDGSQLTGHARMQWKEFAMLLGNDVVEGREAEQMTEVDRAFLLLKAHMRRLREELGITSDAQPTIEHLVAPAAFQQNLAAVWERYLALQNELAADEFANAKAAVTSFESSVATVDASMLSGRVAEVWQRESGNLAKLGESLKQASDIQAMRIAFKPLSEEIGVLARSFGFGDAGPIYELHCPMAFQGQGAVWYQENDQVRNPYYGSSMLTCADRVERVVHDEPAMPDASQTHQNHSQH